MPHGKERHTCPFCRYDQASPFRKESDGYLLGSWIISCGCCDFECDYEHWFSVSKLINKVFIGVIDEILTKD